MSNKFLEKAGNLKMSAPKASLTAKLGLGASLTGLGISAVNYLGNRQSREMDQKRIAIEKQQAEFTRQQAEADKKALSALRSIHNTIKKQQG